MKNDVHLAVSFFPLKPSQPVLTVCGKEIRNAAFPFLIEGDIRGETLDKLGNCRKCVGAVLAIVDANSEQMYVYGCIEANQAEARDE